MLKKQWNRAGRLIIYALVLIVFVGPYWGIVATAFSGLSVKPGELLAWPNQPSFDNFIFAWQNLDVWRYLMNSVIVVTFGTVLQTMVSAMAAYALARKKFRGVAFVALLILSTLILPEEVIAIPLYLVVLQRLPVIDVSLYNTYAAMILPIVGWAFSIFLLTEFMKAIPKELEEAARIDGANEFQIFYRVVLPLVKPALGTCIIFGFIMIWDQYLLPLIVVNDEGLYTIPVILGSIRVDESITPNIFIAVTLLAMLPSIVIYLLLQKHFNRGLMSGAVKG
ncbi:carbohydrate ABC transporter permease [Martelella radicis]|uniref:Multiple sugar transport system permease protein n=1 Tax=Martelella radicis TaxID=1397476 RepID=A0A7W6PCT4_9HYPH|nr:carbohydrate ABC transporter permease [Martelella radicis]MBB4123717.1 multiple sugar transport system permease protein [Martelella radicis]